MNLKTICLVLIVCFISINAVGQNRNIDLKVVLSDSISGDTVFSPGEIPVTTYLINNGPDSIYACDRFKIEFVFGNSYYTPVFRFPEKNMGIGDTFVYKGSLPLVYKVNVFDITYCAIVEIYSPCRTEIDDETKEQLKNNTHCQPISHISNYVSVNNSKLNSFNVFPNPSKNIINIESENDFSTEVFDLNGKRVSPISHINSSGREAKIDISNLQNGIYLLRIASNHKISLVRVQKS